MTLAEMKNVDIRSLDPDDLVDIRSVVIDTNLPIRERMLENARQLGGNPYTFKCNNIVIMTSYANTAATLNDRMESYLRTL
jgi:hypothetical protein